MPNGKNNILRLRINYMIGSVVSNFNQNSDSFAERLKKSRETRGLNQTELAAMTKLQPAAIGHFEKKRRKPSFANIRALSKALNVSSDYLLGRTLTMEGSTTIFRGEENLTDSDRNHIQMMIDVMNTKKADNA